MPKLQTRVSIVSRNSRSKHTAAGEEHQQPECISCAIDPNCGQVVASFSSSAKYFVMTCNGPDIPYQVFLEADGDTSEF